RKRYEAQIQHHATHDALTGLPNRTQLYELLRQAIEAEAARGAAVAVAFVDLDQFKLVNDSLGHAAGDELLRIVGERLKQCLRDSDRVARQGGDEFVLLLRSQVNEDELCR